MCVWDGVLGEHVFEVEGVLNLVYGFYGDGGEYLGEEFSGGGGERVATRDDGAEGVLTLVVGGFVDLGLALHAGGDFSGGAYALVKGVGDVVGEG